YLKYTISASKCTFPSLATLKSWSPDFASSLLVSTTGSTASSSTHAAALNANKIAATAFNFRIYNSFFLREIRRDSRIRVPEIHRNAMKTDKFQDYFNGFSNNFR